jgi:hypothetical protein
VGECCATHLPLGGMTVGAGPGGAAMSAFPVVDVGVELKVTISLVNRTILLKQLPVELGAWREG